MKGFSRCNWCFPNRQKLRNNFYNSCTKKGTLAYANVCDWQKEK